MGSQTEQRAKLAGYELTLDILAESKSARAVDTLLSALGDTSPHIQERIYDVLLNRGSGDVKFRIIPEYHRLAPTVRARILDGVDQFAPQLKRAIEQRTGEAKGCALSIISDARRASLLPLTAALLRGIDERFRERAAVALNQSVSRLLDVVRKLKSRDADKLPEGVKKALDTTLSVLSEALRTFAVHQQAAVLQSLLNFGPRGQAILLGGFSEDQGKVVVALTDLLLKEIRPETDTFIARMLFSEKSYVYKKGEYVFRHRHEASSGRIVCAALKLASVAELAQLEQNFGRKAWWKTVQQHSRRLDGAAQEKLVAHIENRRVPPADAAPLLQALLESRLPEIRRRALAALENKGNDSAAPYTHLLSDSDEKIQLRATSEVIKAPAPDREELIVRQLLSDFSSVRDLAAREVARFSFQAYFRAFERLDPHSRRQAAVAIGKIDQNLTDKLREALSRENEQLRVRALNMIAMTEKGKDFAAEIINVVQTGSPTARVSAVAALASINSPRARDTARACLDDLDRRVVANAIDCLTKMRDSEALDAVLKLRNHPGSRVRSYVVHYLHAVGNEEYRRELLSMVNDPVTKMRLSAIMVVEKIWPPDAVDILRSLAHRDQTPEVRTAARTALQKRGLPLEENESADKETTT